MTRYRDAAGRGATSVGVVEWSAPEGADWRDEDTWRLAHPHWTPRRLEYLRQQIQVLPEEDFQSQYLCMPQAERRKTVDPSEPLADPAVWAELRDPGVQPAGGVVGAVEDWHGRTCGAALAWPTDDGPVVVGRRFDRVDQAFAWVAQYAQQVLCGLSLRGTPQAQILGATGVGTRESTTALPLLRRLARERRVRWDGDDLADQLIPLRVIPKEGGLKVTGTEHYIARPAAWAVQQVTNSPAVAASIL